MGLGNFFLFLSLSPSAMFNHLSTRNIIDFMSEIPRVCNTGLETFVVITFQMDKILNNVGR